MKFTNLSLTGNLEDGTPVSFSFPDTQPTPPTPTKKHVLLNCINWGSLANFPLEATEYTYFVLLVARDGNLIFGSETAEKKFISDIHAMGKKASFSVAGGTQNVNDITNAITSTTARTNLINKISARMAWGYDGVTLDIENTNIQPDVLVTFFKELRAKLGIGKIIGVYTQPYQFSTVWAKTEQIEPYINWLSPMIYDFANTVSEAKQYTLKWLPKLNNNKSKLLFGGAVNYDATGLDLTEWGQILDWINQEGLGGIGVWNDQLYTASYRDVLKSKFK